MQRTTKQHTESSNCIKFMELRVIFPLYAWNVQQVLCFVLCVTTAERRKRHGYYNAPWGWDLSKHDFIFNCMSVCLCLCAELEQQSYPFRFLSFVSCEVTNSNSSLPGVLLSNVPIFSCALYVCFVRSRERTKGKSIKLWLGQHLHKWK